MKRALAVVTLLLASTCLFAVAPNELLEPPVFTSSNHALDILITAKTKPITLQNLSPTAWVFEVCYRRDAVSNICPADSRTASAYGGMRLQLSPGDHLKIRFINQLPPAPPDAEHVQDMPEMLKNNPTNLHTHGLIVEPRQATPSNPTYGDYIYVLAYPNGKLPTIQMPGLDYTDQSLDYDIYIPPNHPTGLFWIHPHVHGLALNQISYGMAGIITIGSENSILSRPASASLQPLVVRHLTLKDMQVFADNTVLSQEDPGFCDPDYSTGPPRNGYCPGIDTTGQGGPNYTGGKWFFSINGQVYPTISLAQAGEVWRITQASGSRSYELAINDDGTGKPRQFQVLAVDGVALDGNAGLQALARAAAGKFTPVTCTFSLPAGAARPVCATTLRMMPSSRIEIWVPPSSTAGSATLVTHSYPTGPAGDDWPAANLAHVMFTPGLGAPTPGLIVKGSAASLLSKSGLLGAPVMIDGVAGSGGISLQNAPKLALQLSAASATSLREHLTALSAPEDISSAPCAALPPGHHRRIFFGTPADNPDAFGLGYEEIDPNGNVVPGTFRDITAFDHTVIDVCLPLGKGNTTVAELWELVNVAGEDHNFHIHQTKFRILTPIGPGPQPSLLMDNVPLFHGSDPCDGSIATWQSGACQVQPVFVSIPFSEVGDFVYHCHILEHEDGGMMAHIRVVPYQ